MDKKVPTKDLFHKSLAKHYEWSIFRQADFKTGFGSP
jgi:hypothetical protein